MKLAAIFITVITLLTGCSTVSKMATGDEVTDFKASADANAAIAKANADVHWAQQEAIKACFTKATTDIQIAFCSMTAQSTNMSQHTAGRPATNRNPTAGAEANAVVGTAAVNATGAVGTAAVLGKAASDIANAAKVPQANVTDSGNTTSTTTTTNPPAFTVAP